MADPIANSVLANHEELLAFCGRVLAGAGVPEPEARVMADTLVSANLRGVDTHGVMRLAWYTASLRNGVVQPTLRLETVRETVSTALLDAHQGLGQVAGHRAMELAIAKARQTGVAWVTVRNSNHFGAAAYYSMMALPHDMIGFVTTNASPRLAPTGGIDRLFGNNPWSYSIPAGSRLPVVLDLANSVVAAGKIRIALKEGKTIPEGWALTEEGEPTTDPKAALDGILLAIGGYKGYGITLVMDLITGVLANSAYGPRVHSMDEVTEVSGVGHTFMALDISAFDDVAAFKARVDGYIEEIKASKKAKGVQEILLPGEPEFRRERERREKGIPLGPKAAEELRNLGREMGIPISL